jgi:cytochrome c556
MARKRKTYQERADKIRADLARLSNNMAALTAYVPDGETGGDMALSRTFDGIADTAAMLSVMSAHARQNHDAAITRADRVRRAVRKALGYTYP